MCSCIAASISFCAFSSASTRSSPDLVVSLACLFASSSSASSEAALSFNSATLPLLDASSFFIASTPFASSLALPISSVIVTRLALILSTSPCSAIAASLPSLPRSDAVNSLPTTPVALPCALLASLIDAIDVPVPPLRSSTTSYSLPPRCALSFNGEPGGPLVISFTCFTSMLVTSLPSTSTRTSPVFIPAFAAGPAVASWVIFTTFLCFPFTLTVSEPSATPIPPTTAAGACLQIAPCTARKAV